MAASNEEIEIRIATITGQMAGMDLLIMALLETHPDRDSVSALARALQNKMLGNVLYRPFPDEFITAMDRYLSDRLRDRDQD